VPHRANIQSVSPQYMRQGGILGAIPGKRRADKVLARTKGKPRARAMIDAVIGIEPTADLSHPLHRFCRVGRRGIRQEADCVGASLGSFMTVKSLARANAPHSHALSRFYLFQEVGTLSCEELVPLQYHCVQMKRVAPVPARSNRKDSRNNSRLPADRPITVKLIMRVLCMIYDGGSGLWHARELYVTSGSFP
jgi:hypothetical protein